MLKSLTERGLDGAQSYIERMGMTLLERSFKVGRANVELAALDEDDLVMFSVRIRQPRGGELRDLTPQRIRALLNAGKKYAAEKSISASRVRVDSIDLLMLSDDRAHLRHSRTLDSFDIEQEQADEAE
jgi:putative endonuclease